MRPVGENQDTADTYRWFAEREALPSSPIYGRLASRVADAPDLVRLLDAEEPARRQPNLLFAALRWHGLPVEEPDEAVAWALANWASVAAVLRSRRTQTNEAARCAPFLPVLAGFAESIALVDLGASAGLGLLPDYWDYEFSGDRAASVRHSRGPGGVPVRCLVHGPAPLPSRAPRIEWRAGLDLAPIDPADPDARRWLTALVWPEHHERRARLIGALDVAAAVRPRVVTGDLVDDTQRLLAQVPAGLTVVVQHSASLAYLSPAERRMVVDMLRDRGVHRIGQEGSQVLEHLAEHLPDETAVAGRFVLSCDDTVLGFTAPHGDQLWWRATNAPTEAGRPG